MSNTVPPGGTATPPDASAPTAFPPPPPPPAEEPKKKGAGRLIGRIVLGVVVVIGGIALKSTVFGDGAKEAKAGDCIAANKEVKDEGTTKTGAKVVDCGGSDAKFTVVGRVDGETSTETKACDQFFKEGEEFLIFASNEGKGYVLCLRPKA